MRFTDDVGDEVAPLVFRACTSGRVDCRVADPNWPAYLGRPLIPALLHPVYEDSAGVHLSYLRQYETGFKKVTWVTELLGKRVERGFEHGQDGQSGCFLIMQASSGGWAGAVFSSPGRDISLAWGDDDRPKTVNVSPLSTSPSYRYFEGLYRQDSRIVLGGRPPYVFRTDDRAFAALGSLPAGGSSRLLGNELVYGTDESPGRVLSVNVLDGARTVLADDLSGPIVDFTIDVSTRDLVWTADPQNGANEVQLWVMSFGIDGGAPTKRLLTTLAGAGFTRGLAANGGVVVVPLYFDGSAILVDTKTAAITAIPSEPDRALMTPLWVNDRDVWFLASSVLPGQPGYPNSSGIVRLSRSHLQKP